MYTGGYGLGLVIGWLAASGPVPRTVGRVGGLLVVLGAGTAEAALLGDNGGAFVAASLAGFGVHQALRIVLRRRSS